MLYANNDNFASFLSYVILISFSCFIILAMTSNTMLTRSDESRGFCLAPDFKGKAFRLVKG